MIAIMTEEPTPQPRTVGVDALKALAHPLRVRLFSALTSYGPATASALADRLGESSGATSYHLRQLEKHGFVREDTDRGNARDRWWERVPEPIELANSTFFTNPAGRAAGELVEAEFIRLENERLMEYWAARDRLEPAWVHASQTSSANLTLTPDELERFGRDFERLVERYRSRTGDEADRRRVDLHLRAFPVVDQGPPEAPRTESTTETTTDPDSPEGAQR
jgi:DNA-binding transcriptional ArsR family regulator